ncbi:MAG: sortase [Clostridia bacterium]|nr:sortase [Clostridia bacterium]
MANKKKNKNPIATLLVAIGVIALLGALGWYVHNLIEDLNAEKASRQITERLIAVIDEKKTDKPTSTEDADDSEDVVDDYVEPTVDPELLEMETNVVDEVSYIGIVEIPSSSLSLPVAYDWDYDKLAISPCRYAGSYYTNDLVICAHDYGSHFRAIRSLGIGDSVLFTTIDGETIRYIVANVETVQPTAISDMIENSGNSESRNTWDLTLFTCNIGGMTRCAVRCQRVN